MIDFEINVNLKGIENLKSLNAVQLRLIALDLSRMVVKRTQQGKGSAGPLKAYSTRPLIVPDWGNPRPKGGILKWYVPRSKAWGSLVGKKDRKGNLKRVPFRLYLGGYKEYRGAMGRTESPPNLVFSGRMLGSFGIITSDAVEAKIGFLDPRERLKAKGNQARGRVFVPPTNNEAQRVFDLVARAMAIQNKLD